MLDKDILFLTQAIAAERVEMEEESKVQKRQICMANHVVVLKLKSFIIFTFMNFNNILCCLVGDMIVLCYKWLVYQFLLEVWISSFMT